MFFNFVSPLARYGYDMYNYMFPSDKKFRVCSINLGGRTKNPFEYLFDTPHMDSFTKYKEVLSTLTKKQLITYRHS